MSLCVHVYMIEMWNYLCNQCQSLIKLWVWILLRRGALDTLCDKICQWLVTGRWFSLVLSTNKTDHHDITEILFKVAVKHHNTKPWNVSFHLKENCLQTDIVEFFRCSLVLWKESLNKFLFLCFQQILTSDGITRSGLNYLILSCSNISIKLIHFKQKLLNKNKMEEYMHAPASR